MKHLLEEVDVEDGTDGQRGVQEASDVSDDGDVNEPQSQSHGGNLGWASHVRE